MRRSLHFHRLDQAFASVHQAAALRPLPTGARIIEITKTGSLGVAELEAAIGPRTAAIFMTDGTAPGAIPLSSVVPVGRRHGVSVVLASADGPIHQMTRLDKLTAMEALWADLSQEEQALESPAWHADALTQTELSVAAGEEKPIDWETAKKELRKRFE